MPQFDSEPRATTGTRGHAALHRFLVDRMGFIVEDEHRVGVFSIDCYVPEVHAGFEYDGKDFHASTKNRVRDVARDNWILGTAGIPIMRVIDADLKQPGTLFERISGWLEVFEDDLVARRDRERGL